MINWEDEAAQYRSQYEDEDGIHEWVDSLVPIYYGEISSTFNALSLMIEIAADDVGVPIWQVMVKHIFNDYMEKFMEAWALFEGEEEE